MKLFKFFRGLKASLPTLSEGQPGYVTDEKRLYIGNADGENTQIPNAQDLEAKQDKLVGTAGQVVGFDSSGNAIAQEAPEGGVLSFNGRAGAVVPQEGDYNAEMVGAVPEERTVNGKALSTDITLTADDIGARSNTWMPTAEDVGARPSTWMPTADDIGAMTQLQADAKYLPFTGGVLTGSLTLSGAPTADLHAATKAYVDGSIQSAILDSWEASY